MPISRKSESRPKVRASSGMMGTTRRPTCSSRTRLRSSRAKTMVVDAAWLPDPLRNSAKTLSSTALAWRERRTTRLGSDPSRAWRRSIMYSCSGVPGGGR